MRSLVKMELLETTVCRDAPVCTGLDVIASTVRVTAFRPGLGNSVTRDVSGASTDLTVNISASVKMAVFVVLFMESVPVSLVGLETNAKSHAKMGTMG